MVAGNTATICGVATRTDEPAPSMEKKMVKFAIAITLGLVSQVFAQQPVELPEVVITPNHT